MCEFRNRRCACHSGNAAFCQEFDFDDPLLRNASGELENVSTDWIFYLGDCVGRIYNAGVAWMLEVIENLGRVHRDILREMQDKNAGVRSQNAELKAKIKIPKCLLFILHSDFCILTSDFCVDFLHFHV